MKLLTTVTTNLLIFIDGEVSEQDPGGVPLIGKN